MSAREAALDAIGTAGHAVQLYKADDELLIRNVGDYLSEGLWRGDGLLVIATGEHNEQFLRRLEDLGANPQAAVDSGQLTLLDAAQTLSRFTADGQTDWENFAAELRDVANRIGKARAGLRAYGEMVGLLWASGKYASAMRLEKLWNELLAIQQFSLFCGYPIDIFGREFQLGAVEGLLCAHTHLVPGAADSSLDDALRAAMDEVLGRRAEGVRSLMSAAGEASAAAMLPPAESAILWLRGNLPDEADSVLSKARRYYQESKRLGTREIPHGARN